MIKGIDRTGKDSIVTFLTSYFYTHRPNPNEVHLKVVHWGFPEGENNTDKIAFQKKDFKQKAKKAREFFMKNPDGVLIWNRSHIGEHVYGPLYRNENTDWINEFEKNNIIEHLHNLADLYLFLLDGNIDFLLSRDDGNSFTTDKKIKSKEQHAFVSAFINSKIPNKEYIIVADYKSYFKLQDIQDEVIKKLVKTNE